MHPQLTHTLATERIDQLSRAAVQDRVANGPPESRKARRTRVRAQAAGRPKLLRAGLSLTWRPPRREAS
jgi:hypothetical protein